MCISDPDSLSKNCILRLDFLSKMCNATEMTTRSKKMTVENSNMQKKRIKTGNWRPFRPAGMPDGIGQTILLLRRYPLKKIKMVVTLAVLLLGTMTACAGQNAVKEADSSAELEARQQKLWELQSKYGVDHIVERPKVEKVNGIYWRYADVSACGVCVLSASPCEFKNDNDEGGDMSGEIVVPETLGGKAVEELSERLFRGKSVSCVVMPCGMTKCPEGRACYFGDWDRLEKFAVADDHPAYSAKDGFLCDKAGKTLLCCPAGREGDVIVPDGIETIGGEAFAGCRKVKSLTIPPSVREMRKAFASLYELSCKGLRAVYISDLASWCRISFECTGSGGENSFDKLSNPLAQAHNL